MTKPDSLPSRFFDRVVLQYPVLVILCLLVVVAFFGFKTKDFQLDASSETLVLEHDKDLNYARIIHSRYGGNDYLVMTYAPKDDLFSDRSLLALAKLVDELKQLPFVSSVVSMLNVPLLENSIAPLEELAGNVMSLESPLVDKKLAKIEFKESPLYQNLIVSPDLKTTAIQINLSQNGAQRDLSARRKQLREKQAQGRLTDKEAAELKKVALEFKQLRVTIKKERHNNIAVIRAIMDKYRGDADLFLGGVSMIADDLISFIKKDLKMFGIGVLFFLIITLSIIFKKLRWIMLPILCCAFSAVCMTGLLGLFGWEVTVISSNFISLQLIITMAITIHLIVRYRELHAENPETEHRKLVLDAVCLMLRPCLYAALTTIAGFGSLLLCDILPVITFGWMMIAGITVSLIVTFLLFPSVMMLMSKGTPPVLKGPKFSLTSILARFTENHGNMIMVISCLAMIISGIGITRLVVENSFIDYFKKTTEIYQGMKVIDQNLGGTTPLDVIVELDESKEPAPGSEPGSGQGVAAQTDEAQDDDLDEFDEFDEAQDEEKYWFTSEKMERVKKIHDYLDGIPETGKVLSLATMLKIAEKLNSNTPLDNFELALLYTKIPDKFRDMVLKPYVSVENNQVRFSIRVRDSEKTLQRDRLLKKIKKDLIGKVGLKEDKVHLSGLLVLYNNMLQSLFSSQIKTLGVVVFALMFMFMVLFRSVKIALIAIFPNLLSIAVVLGVMGWLKIPLDMMTITIAAISVGIAVDDTIHYIHRFIHEFEIEPDYINAVHRCHNSIGHAMYYTSVTIIIGFSILTLSSFIPSIYFGLLTGLAMFIALIAALTLLPQMIVFFKPLGPEPVKGEV